MRVTPLVASALGIVYCQLPRVWTQATQPGLYNSPRLPADFSTKPSHWEHRTPLLPLSQRIISRRQRANLLPHIPRATGHWNGWQDINYIFSFGDSYTSTGFNISGPQPDEVSPLGNPEFPGMTSSNGPNYVDFLTETYNLTLIETYDLGFGGATIDNKIIASAFGLEVKSFSDQVSQEFQPRYVGSNTVSWSSDDTLFTVFFGINDALQSYENANNDSVQYAAIKSYENIVNQLYNTGARNFLFMNVPPIDRAPISLNFGVAQRQDLASWIARFNFRLGALASNLAKRDPDATVFQFNTEDLFSRVLDNPRQFPETAGYQNTTDYCVAYQSGTPEFDYFDPACGIPVQEYFWLNTLHPTYPMHNFMGSQIAQLLQS